MTSDDQFPKYAIVTCMVTSRPDFGIFVEEIGSRQAGFVDTTDMADSVDQFSGPPETGDNIRAVVLGRTRDGRLRLSMRPRDLKLVAALHDPEAAFLEWRNIERNLEDRWIKEKFYGSPNAVALLDWALSHPTHSSAHKQATNLLSGAPAALHARLSRDMSVENDDRHQA
jgi:predicted RNA-binding protein with RPS1 domain